MTNVLGRWFKKYFSDPEGIILAVLLLLGFAVVIFLGDMLAPVLASVVIAYLLEAIVKLMERRGVSRILAVFIVFSFFLAFLLFFFLGLVPLLSKQVAQLVQEIPNMATQGQQGLLHLPELYPQFISEVQVREVMTAIRSGLTSFGQQALSFSLASISTLFTLVVYLVLLPVLVFFFMKDKQMILNWVMSYVPRERGVAIRVWREMDLQIGNYVRGKFSEILIVGVASYLVFTMMGLNYASLLGALVGLSVVVPYVGAVVVTVPVFIIGSFQWGWGADFAYLALAYLIIQAIDGNVLVPWLFSEAVNLHPVAIIVAILLFGGVWGFWGVFFAIPLATLVKAVLNAWPRLTDEQAAA
jgi:putative permease